jgi:uncharacterized protein (DUF924 family)
MTAQEVLDYWFGSGPWSPQRLEERTRFWFGGDGIAARTARDAQIRSRLEPLLTRAAQGEFAAWPASPRRRLALIVLFDQVPRNAYRGTPAAFAFDRKALALASEGLQRAADAALDPVERVFFYLPLEHAESLAPPELRDFCATTARYAHEHRQVIARFGRFPHRNAVLGRESTPEELEWLKSAPGW